MQNPSTATASAPPVQVRHRGAIWTLLLLAPIISEVLSGSTRLSFLFALLPEILCWGCGALLARELVRRWRAGATSLFLLGLALSIAEEFVIQQTSLAPLPFPGANAAYGRYLGINWLYFLFMLGYESVWVVLVPVEVTELLIPAQRHEPWLSTRGLLVTVIAFLIGCRVAWYGWTQRVLPSMHVAPYHPPLVTTASGLMAIGALMALAFLVRAQGHPGLSASRRVRSLWLTAIAAWAFGTGWWGLMTLVFSPHPRISAPAAILVGLVWAMAGLGLFSYWSTGSGWTNMHRWAAAFGATLSCMLPSYGSLAGWSKRDLIFKILVNLVAVIWLLMLARSIRRRPAAEARAF